MKTKILSLLIIVTLLISSAAIAQPGSQVQHSKKNDLDRKAMMMKKRQTMQKGDRQNFFTEEQKEAMKMLRLETAKQVKPFKNELNELMARQQTLTTANNADLDAIYANIDKISEVKTGIAKIVAKQQLEFRSLLTEEQQLKFDSRKNKMNQGHGETFMKNRKGKPG